MNNKVKVSVDEALDRLWHNSYIGQTGKNEPVGMLSFEYEDVEFVNNILTQTDIDFTCEPNNLRKYDESDVMVFAMIINNQLKTYAPKFHEKFFEAIEPKFKRKEKLNKLNQ
jgi:hypothetical protein